MFKRLRGILHDTQRFGTANTLIYVRDSGIVLNEPSVVAGRMTHSRRQIIVASVGAKKCGTNPRAYHRGSADDGCGPCVFTKPKKLLPRSLHKEGDGNGSEPEPPVRVRAFWLHPSGAACHQRIGGGRRRRAAWISSLDHARRSAPASRLGGDAVPWCRHRAGGTSEGGEYSMNGIVYAAEFASGGDKFDR